MRAAKLFVLMLLSLGSGQIFATDYLTAEEALPRLFPDAVQSQPRTVTLTEAQQKQIRSTSGVRQRWQGQKVWRVEGADGPLGWMILDDVVGKHEFISYAVGISDQGRVRGIEILSYRETYGGEVRDQGWRGQFIGKSAADRLKLGKDIDNISGATLSCRNLTDGVRRLLALQALVLQDAGSKPSADP